MSDLLLRMAERALGLAHTVAPVVASRYVPRPEGPQEGAPVESGEEALPLPGVAPLDRSPAAPEGAPPEPARAPDDPPLLSPPPPAEARAAAQRQADGGPPDLRVEEAPARPAAARTPSPPAAARVGSGPVESLPPYADGTEPPTPEPDAPGARVWASGRGEPRGPEPVRSSAAAGELRPAQEIPQRAGRSAESRRTAPEAGEVREAGEVAEEARRAPHAPFSAPVVPSRAASAPLPEAVLREPGGADPPLLSAPPAERPAGVRREEGGVRPAAPPAAEPPIRVTIGRIEVRAVMPERPPEPAPRPAWQPPVLSLEEYLRDGGRR